MAAIPTRTSPLGDIQSLLDIFKGRSNTTNSSEKVSPEAANALVQQVLAGNNGLASLGVAQKGAGLYNSTVNSQLSNDLIARTSAEVAARSSTKSTTTKVNPQLNPLATIGGLAASSALRVGAKKLGLKTPDQYIEKGIDSISNYLGGDSFVGGSGFDVGSLASTPVDTSSLQNLDFLSSLNEDSLFGSSGSSSSGGSDSGGDVDATGGSSGAGVAVGLAGGAALGGLAAGAGSAGAGAAAGGYAIAAGDTAFGLGAGTAASSAGAGIGEALTALAVWIVCTELYRQGRLPYKWYRWGAREFAKYDDRGKQGYYIWAVPAVAHLRAHPDSILSKLLCAIFNSRAQYLAAKAGCDGARKTVTGWFWTKSLYALCWTLSRTIARKPIDWTQVYSKEKHNV